MFPAIEGAPSAYSFYQPEKYRKCHKSITTTTKKRIHHRNPHTPRHDGAEFRLYQIPPEKYQEHLTQEAEVAQTTKIWNYIGKSFFL